MYENIILQGDALSILKTLPDNLVQCVVTSPPYYRLRDYGVEGQIGLEESPQTYVSTLAMIFREIKRVLRKDGTCWLNIGDTYAGGGRGGQTVEKLSEHWQPDYPAAVTPTGFKQKDLMMIPARLAIALQEDGWYLRSDIIWHKLTAMPESVQDRPTSAHEHVFLLAKSARYFYDADAIREPGAEWKGQSGTFSRAQGKATLLTIPGQSRASHREEREDRVPTGRNKRDVWTLASQPYPEAHFATMPPKLVEPCILAGSSPRACEQCGAPWERVTEHNPMVIRNGPKAGGYGSRTTDSLSGTMVSPAETRTVGWRPTCTHDNAGTGQCIILDPFMGAGTVALVALQHQRTYLGIELNPAYIALAEKRIETVQPHLWSGPESEVAS